MDWFLRWPRKALIQVAQHFLSDYNIKCSHETKSQMVQVSGSLDRAFVFGRLLGLRTEGSQYLLILVRVLVW